MKPIDIVITTWQREWMSMACIKSIKRNTATPYRIILIDNGSSELAQEFYLEFADIYVKLDKNYGLEYAKHVAMTYVESEYFISMDNDILVYQYLDKDWLQKLIDLMDKNPDYVAISCRPQILIGTGMYMFKTDKEIVDFPHVPGYARIMKTDFVNKVGAWNDKRPSRGHEELWFGEKAAQYGVKTGWANFVNCYHLWGDPINWEDTWGYPKDTDSGHNPVWPIPGNDKEFIFEKTGIRI